MASTAGFLALLLSVPLLATAQAHPVRTATGLLLAAGVVAGRTVDAAFGAYFFKNYTLPAVKSWATP
ncbi:MAG TPA: hypothetical protein VF283_01920 [Bryobacteraceae bacterium]